MRRESVDLSNPDEYQDCENYNEILMLLNAVVRHFGGAVTLPLKDFVNDSSKYDNYPINYTADALKGILHVRAEAPKKLRTRSNRGVSGTPAGSGSEPAAEAAPAGDPTTQERKQDDESTFPWSQP